MIFKVRQWRSHSPAGATRRNYAGVAQLIERFLAKEEAQGLSPCTRTNIKAPLVWGFYIGAKRTASGSPTTNQLSCTIKI
jgi:hypothetical protein